MLLLLLLLLLLLWASLVPGYKPEWFLGLREKSSGGQLVGYIMATPATICVDKKQLPMASIDFLTLRNDLRSQHLAPLLIQEITRRVNLCGVWQALYFYGRELGCEASGDHEVLPSNAQSAEADSPQVCKVSMRTNCAIAHHHRGEKVLPGMTVGEMESWLDLDEELPEKAFEVSPAAASTPPRKTACCDPFTFISKATSYSSSAKGAAFSMRMMTENDVKKVRDLWHRSCSDKYRLCATFSEEETRHFLSPREGLLWTFVATDPKKPHVITGFDVVNALEVLSNDPDMLREQKFLKGDADLHYYLFNYRVPGARGMNGRQVGILPL
eukprot:jgi/Bigna1/69230/fgenesh1_pg.8_\